VFELNISCTKELSTLKIDFTDGTSVVEYKDRSEPKRPKKVRNDGDSEILDTVRPNQPAECLDLGEDYSHVSSAVVNLPEVTRRDREVKIAPELQNLDI